MAQIIGVAGRDAVRKSAEKIHEAAEILGRLSSLPTEDDLAQLERAIKEPVPWLKGAKGECRTACELNRLSDDYVVFHDYHLRQSNGDRAEWNIDHVVVGRTGILTIDSKNRHADSVEPSGTSVQTKSLLRKTIGQAMAIKNLLSSDGVLANVWVQAVVVFTDPKTTVRQTHDSNVWVLPLRMLLGHIEDGEQVLSPNHVARAWKTLEQRRGRLPIR